MRGTGFRNKLPRRGSREDAKLRRRKLKAGRTRLPKLQDLEKLAEEATRMLSRKKGELGIPWGEV